MFDRPEDAVQQQKVYESYASVKTLNLMAEITSTENKLDSINREISKLLMDKETRDITNMTKIESRLSKLASLSTHLTEAVEKKSLITSRLQKPYTGENLIIDASFIMCLVVVYMCVTVCSDTCCSM
ncbi:hypothetical protein EB796_022103 [Bugula neritina]|uniref:Uncharacterized protein n=1 Tax=Bugula neritina TaxID=10212 RepID=A0A7J7J163_BUGNE|nr:hypothetical protein EB796_022103 [Bugula neritina]